MKTILITDDVEGWRNHHKQVVEELIKDAEIYTAECAKQAYDLLLQEIPFDIIITDMQMETDFEPKYAGEWLVEQIKTFYRYKNTKVVIISAAYNIRHIAQTLGAECIPKSTALKCISAYKEIFGV